MTQAAKAQEPSMEEILASIRRIIADDDAAKTPAKAAEPAKPAPAPAPAPAPKAAAPAPAAPALRPAPAPPRPATPAPRPAPPPPAPAISAQDDIDAMFGAPEPETESNPNEAPSADILELTEAMEALPEPHPSPALRRIDAMSDVVEAPPGLPAPAPLPPAPATVEQARRQFQEKTEPDRQLLSAATTAAVDSAFNSLAQTVLVRNDLTLDGLVREMLRPMLKAWLDDNLPNMVERLVRAEIERVSRGRSSS